MGKIAVIDDDIVFLEMMATVLTETGWDVRTFGGSRGMFAALRRDRPDVAILDIRMETPEVGWAMIERLVADPELRAIPVIVCSGAIRELEERRAWLADRGIATLPKPFDLEQLFAALDVAVPAHSERAR